MNTPTISFLCRVRYNDPAEAEDQLGPSLWFDYRYDVEKHISSDDTYPFLHDEHIVVEFLENRGITEADIKKWIDYFLYEKVLSDWLNANRR